jgi:hypothetical protein
MHAKWRELEKAVVEPWPAYLLKEVWFRVEVPDLRAIRTYGRELLPCKAPEAIGADHGVLY